MPTNTWPATLPQSFTLSSYNEAIAENTIRDNFDTGPAGVRPRSTAAPYRIAGTMIMTQEQWVELKDFCADVLVQRSLPFGFPEPVTSCTESPITELLCRIPEPPTRTAQGADNYEVNLVFEVLPQ